jgi:hypothetical protein
MPKRLLYLLVLAVIPVASIFAFYKLVLGSPPIPLPKITLAVNDARFRDYLENAKVDRLTITWVTNGDVVASADGEDLAEITYNLGSFQNTVNLGEAIILSDSAWWVRYLLYPPIKLNATAASVFFYHVIPVKITLVLES